MHIQTVVIAVPDPPKSAHFFRETLDLPVTERNDTVRVQVGTSNLVLEKGEAGPAGYYHLAFDIPENSIVAARDLLRSRMPIIPAGNDGIVPGTSSWDSHSVYFNAPGNLTLEVIARHRQKNAISTPFTLANIQHISEVGIPVEDTICATQEIKAAFGLDPFDPPSNTFAPVGTDDGLIILVRSGRIWFPDQVATPRPVDITIDAMSTTLVLTPTATIRGIDPIDAEQAAQ